MKNSLDILKDLEHTLSDEIMGSLLNICEQLYLSKNDEVLFKNILTTNKNELNRISKVIKKYLKEYIKLIKKIKVDSHSPLKTKTKSNRMKGGGVLGDFSVIRVFILLLIIHILLDFLLFLVGIPCNKRIFHRIFIRIFNVIRNVLIGLSPYEMRRQWNRQIEERNRQIEERNMQRIERDREIRESGSMHQQEERQYWNERARQQQLEDRTMRARADMAKRASDERAWQESHPNTPMANRVPISIYNAMPISFPTEVNSLLPINPMNAIPDERNLEQESDRFHSQLQQLRETRSILIQQITTQFVSLQDNIELIDRLEFKLNPRNRRGLNRIKDQILSIIKPSSLPRNRLNAATETVTQTRCDLENTNIQVQEIEQQILSIENTLNQIEGVAFEIIDAEGRQENMLTLYPNLQENPRGFRGGIKSSRQSIKTDSKNSKVKRHGYRKTCRFRK